MLKVLFFARIREELDCAELELEWRDAFSSLDALQAFLCEGKDPRWIEVLGQENVIRAVNQSVVPGDIGLHDGDEVAFFPPVTGG